MSIAPNRLAHASRMAAVRGLPSEKVQGEKPSARDSRFSMAVLWSMAAENVEIDDELTQRININSTERTTRYEAKDICPFQTKFYARARCSLFGQSNRIIDSK